MRGACLGLASAAASAGKPADSRSPPAIREVDWPFGVKRCAALAVAAAGARQTRAPWLVLLARGLWAALQGLRHGGGGCRCLVPWPTGWGSALPLATPQLGSPPSAAPNRAVLEAATTEGGSDSFSRRACSGTRVFCPSNWAGSSLKPRARGRQPGRSAALAAATTSPSKSPGKTSLVLPQRLGLVDRFGTLSGWPGSRP